MSRQRTGGPRVLLLALLLGLLGAVALSGVVLLVPGTDEGAGQSEDEPGSSAGSTSVSPGAARALTADPRAVQLLHRAARAAVTTAYTGTAFVSTWDRDGAASYLVDVDNEPGAGTSVRVHASAANPEGAGYTVPAGSQGLGASEAGPSQDEVDLLLHSYDLAVGGAEPVAGRATSVLEVRRPGAGVAARFWVDDGTGLVLRREVYDSAGQVVRANAFVSVDVDAARFVKHPPPLLPGRTGRELSQDQLAGWQARGWACPMTLPGGLRLVDARTVPGLGAGPDAQARTDRASAPATPGAGAGAGASAPPSPVLHLTFSDGLSAVSVFQQRGELDRSGMSGYRTERRPGGQEVLVSQGFPRRVLWSSHGTVFTVVGDGDELVDAAVDALPHAGAEPAGGRDRLRRGIERLASWIDPFG